MGALRLLVGLGVPSLIGAGIYLLLWRGSLTVDLGVGRRVRPLGPIEIDIDAPRESVFDVIASPYLGRTPRDMRDKLIVLERGTDAVLADHRTQVGPVVTSTVEVVTFDRPRRIGFRLVRGPVPHVTEAFDLTEDDGRTTLRYAGEMGTDLWAAGSWWADKVAGHWEAAVQASLDDVRTKAEELARR